MTRSISTVFFAVYLIIALILGVFFAFFLSANQVNLIIESVLSNGAEIGLYARERLSLSENGFAMIQDENLIALMNDLTVYHVSEITLVDEYGDVQASSGPSSKQISDDDIGELHVAITKRDFQGQLFHQKLNRKDNLLTVFVPVTIQETPAVVVVKILLQELSEKMRSLYLQSAYAMAIILALIVLLTLYTWLRIVRPIVRISGAVERVTGGEFETSLNINRKDEIGNLATLVGQMGFALRDIQQNAMSANPLTGLPGNISIENRIRELLESKTIFCIVYGDLDNFKGYNDYYGVARGDDVIIFISKVMKGAFNSVDDDISFLGHQGGDDFIGLCRFDNYEEICNRIVTDFDAGIGTYYDLKDLDRGSISTTDRGDNPITIGIVSISISVVTNNHRDFSNYAEMAGVAMELKKLVKSKTGSVFAIDKRTS